MENIKTCKNCGELHDGSFGKGYFCNLHCARSYASKFTDYKKVSISNSKPRVDYTCSICNKQFKGKKAYLEHKRTCTNKHMPKKGGWTCKYCNTNFSTRKELRKHIKLEHSDIGYKKSLHTCPYCNKNWITTDSGASIHIKYCELNPNKSLCKGHKVDSKTREKISKSMKLAIKEGRATGWHKRKAGTQSYPEQWFEKVIQNEFEDKDYVTELSVGKWFLDFAWKKKMLYIEIDGEQHNDPDRAKSDIKKDEFCKELGWKCLRLKWDYIVNNTQEAIRIAKGFIESGKISEIQWVSKKEQNRILKDKQISEYISSGFKLDKLGRMNKHSLSESVWEERKNLILSSGIDLTKMGWIAKVMKATGLSKKSIYTVVEKFNLQVYKTCRKL